MTDCFGLAERTTRAIQHPSWSNGRNNFCGRRWLPILNEARRNVSANGFLLKNRCLCEHHRVLQGDEGAAGADDAAEWLCAYGIVKPMCNAYPVSQRKSVIWVT